MCADASQETLTDVRQDTCRQHPFVMQIEALSCVWCDMPMKYHDESCLDCSRRGWHSVHLASAVGENKVK
eukprot:10659619-Prorocentrum_lima.AAC.1